MFKIYFAIFMFLFLPYAAAEGPAETIRLEDLVQELAQSNPDVLTAGLRYRQSLLRPTIEGALPDPAVSFGWMSAGSILPGKGVGEDPNANLGVQVSQGIPFPGKRKLRSEIARAEASGAKQIFDAALRGGIAQLKRNYYELAFIHQATSLLTENREFLRQIAQVTEVRYSTGKAMQQDLIRAGTEVSILENRLLEFEQKKDEVQAELNALLNRPAATKIGRPIDATRLPDLPAFDDLVKALAQTAPLLQAEEKMIEGREMGIGLANKELYPDFELMSGYFYQGEMKDMWEVRFGVSIPLFSLGKKRAEIQEAGLKLAEAKQRYRATRQDIELQLRRAYVKAISARKLADLYAKQIVPGSQLALESSLAAYETGGVDFDSVLSNFSTIVDYRMKYLEQQSEYLKALATIEEFTGQVFLQQDKTQIQEARS